MGDILSGLESMGLGNFNNIDLFHDKPKETAKKQESGKPKEVKLEEKDLIFIKNIECICCGREFKEKIVRPGKVKLVAQDVDLRPRYNELDTLKYNVTACPFCGYAALSKEFKKLSDGQVKLIKENISTNFSGLKYENDVYSYDEAIARNKLALINSVIKKGRLSERAYICLSLGWLTRGKAESIAKDDAQAEQFVEQYRKEELEYLKKAAEGFDEALQKESFPICGLDEHTFYYLLAALHYETGSYNESLRYVEKIVLNRNIAERIKDKARRIKEAIAEINKNK